MGIQLSGRRCNKCEKPVEQNMRRTREGHAACYPNLPIIREDR